MPRRKRRTSSRRGGNRFTRWIKNTAVKAHDYVKKEKILSKLAGMTMLPMMPVPMVNQMIVESLGYGRRRRRRRL